ncbi:MAG: alginate O-acetyltransferase AlgX-related protein, partial [Candidatus Xenobia bacterium]
MNAGYPGTHTAEELGAFKKYGLQSHPDTLVLGFFAGNDFFDGDPNRKRIVVDGEFMDIDRRHEHVFLGRPIVFKSRLWMLIQDRLKTWQSMDATHGTTEGPSFTQDVYDNICAVHLMFYDKKLQQKGIWKANIQYILGAMGDMQQLCQSHGIDFRVAIFPCEEQVDPKVFQEVVSTHHLTAADYDLDTPQRLVLEYTAQHHIPTLDMLQEFRRRCAEGASLYIPRNTHLSNAGNELAASLISAWLHPVLARGLQAATAARGN